MQSAFSLALAHIRSYSLYLILLLLSSIRRCRVSGRHVSIIRDVVVCFHVSLVFVLDSLGLPRGSAKACLHSHTAVSER